MRPSRSRGRQLHSDPHRARFSICRRCSSSLRWPPSATRASRSRRSSTTIIVAIKVAVVLCSSSWASCYINTPTGTPSSRRTPALRAFRLERHLAGRRRHLLRLHRLRRRLDRRAGGQEPGARHADRHARQPRDLHRALHAHVARADRPGALHRTSTTPRRWRSRSTSTCELQLAG